MTFSAPSPTSRDFAEKVVYAIACIDRVRMLTALLDTDHEKRMIGKASFLFIDSGISHLRRLNNLVPGGKALKSALNTTSCDYEEHFAAVRDRLTAHRQQQPPLDELRDWRNIQDDYIAYLRSDMAEVYDLICQRETGLPPLAVVTPLTAVQAEALHEATRPPAGFYVDVSAQALASGYTTTVMLSGPAERGQDVLAVADTIRVIAQFDRVLHSEVEWERLTRALYAGEAVNLFDVLYSDQNPEPDHRQPSFLELLPALGTSATTPIAILKASEVSMPSGFRDRDLRNRIAAHIDDSLPLAALLAMIDAFDWTRLSTAVGGALDAFSEACASSLYLRPLRIHRVAMRGLSGVENPDPAPRYSGQ